MADDFTITVQRADEAATTLNRVAVKLDSITQAMADELQAIGVWLEGEVKRRTPVDTGALRNSMFSELRVNGKSLEEMISSPLVYGPPVEYGSKPHFPPSAALKGWARRKLGDENAAYAVAKAIAKRGTEPHDMFTEAFDANQNALADKLERAGIKVSEDVLRTL